MILRQTTRTALQVLALRVSPGSVRRGLDAIASIAGVSGKDISSIVTGERRVTANDVEELEAITSSLGIPAVSLAFIASGTIERAEGQDPTDAPDPAYRFVMSTDEVDRARDVVAQSWNLEAFLRNPVAPWGHNSWSPAVGTWERLSVESAQGVNRLVGYLRPFPLESYPISQTVADQLKGGVLRTVSVGFMPGEWRPRSGLPESDRLFSKNGGYILGSTEAPNLLMECSPCTIPMNPSAVLLESLAVPESESVQSLAPVDNQSRASDIVPEAPTFAEQLARAWAERAQKAPNPKPTPTLAEIEAAWRKQ
jgi:hypothetical protein